VCGLTGLLAAGCVSHAPRPTTWATIRAAEDCTALLGTYANLGVDDQGRSVELLNVLASGGARLGRNEPIALAAPEPDVLEVRGTTVRQRYRFSAGEVTCREGRLLLWTSGFDRAPMVQMNAYWAMTTTITRATDGALLVNETTTGTGLITVVPFVLSTARWYRFEPVE
jgi:hypothetical protein